MWGLGPLIYLADARKNSEVAAISSVSGGSITNGVVAHEVDYGQVDPKTFDAKVTPMVQHVANTGLFFWGPSTNAYVIAMFSVLGVGAAVLVIGLVLTAIGGIDLISGLTTLAGIVLLVVGARWFEHRSAVVDTALAKTHFTTEGRPTRLSEVARSIDHVICSTELQSGLHIYFNPKFIYSYVFGTGKPADMRLSTAVQASACLPGAFSVRRIPAAPYFPNPGEHKEMVLTDGGVYDNMADEWLVHLESRLVSAPALPVTNRVIDEVLIVNASAPQKWSPSAKSRLVLKAELATLLRVKSVMYEVTTKRRRAAWFDAWKLADATGKGQRGTFVHIAQSPYDLADATKHAADVDAGRRARAVAVLALLGDTKESRDYWAASRDRARAVPTVLRKIGRASTIDLLEHSYVLAMCNAHIALGYPLRALPGRERFARLIDGTSAASHGGLSTIDLTDGTGPAAELTVETPAAALRREP
jgi:hypothetical protein